MKIYGLSVTFKCNWFCNYCIVDTHHQPEVTIQHIKNQLDKIEPRNKVSITGGEPGLCSPEIMDYVITELVKKEMYIEVNTNGAFFKNFSQYDKFIDFYFYHCSEYLEQSIFIPNISFDKIDFMVTVTDDSFSNLESFLQYYNSLHINKKIFIYSAIDNHINNTHKPKTLSKRNSLTILSKYRNIIDPDSYEYILGSCTEINKKSGKLFL